MNIIAFLPEHIPQAIGLHSKFYSHAQQNFSLLPPLPDLSEQLHNLTQNGWGFAALQEGKLIGYMSPFASIPHFFGNDPGLYIPLHGLAAQWEDRCEILSRLYQAAAHHWVTKGLVSHGLSLYAFDGELISTFFHLGFGQRVGDALRSTEPIDAPMPPGLRFVELCPSQRQLISPLARALSAHLGASPCFMPSVNASTHEGTRLFAAFKTEELIAYLETH